MPLVLIVDDDRSVDSIIRTALVDLEVEVRAVGTAEEALESIAREVPDVLLLDLVLPGMSGLDALLRIRKSHPRLPVVFMTGRGNSDTAIAVTKEGVQDYLYKPLDLEAIESAVRSALSTSYQLRANGTEEDSILPQDHGDSLVGRSPQMQAVLKAIGRVAGQHVSVLIRGESGTGKELVAEAIVRHSQRAAAPFLAVNCAALSESLLESELFGHEKGSFTGADAQRIGKFEQCSGGTIFLDEIGDMAESVQAKVLRLLQEQRFERVGGNDTICTDVRIIAATNRDLETMCESGQFRKDLFHRLNGYTIQVPPLRERQGDVRLLLEHFLARYNQQLTKNKEAIAPDAAGALLRYSWPGNVRELQALLSKAMLDAFTPMITSELLPEYVRVPSLQHSQLETSEVLSPRQQASMELGPFIDSLLARRRPQNIYAETSAFVDRYLLMRVLNAASGNRSEAARILGITRGSLRNKMKSLGISVDPAAVVHEEESLTTRSLDIAGAHSTID